MKIIKLIVCSFFLIFFKSNIMAQKINSESIMIPEYEIIESQIFKALDSVIFYTKNCTYFTLDKPYHFWINILDEKRLKIESMAYNVSIMNFLLYDPNVRSNGFFYYKDKLVIVNDYTDKPSLFFRNTGKVDTLNYPNSENIMDHLLFGHESVAIYFDYQNGTFFTNEDYIEPCNYSRNYFYYVVKPFDTIEGIAKKCSCSVETLNNVYGLNETIPLKEGYLIIVEYHFENGEFIGATRLQ